MGHAVRTLGQFQASAVGVDRPEVVVALAAEVKRLDDAWKAADAAERTDVHDARVHARFVLRQAENDALTESEWADIDLALESSR